MEGSSWLPPRTALGKRLSHEAQKNMADPHDMGFFFFFFAVLQFHEQKKHDLYVLSGSKFSAVDLDKSYGYFNLFSGYFSYLDLFFPQATL